MVPQHEVARLKANKHRFYRVELRRELKAASRRDGLRRVVELLLDPPDELGTVLVFELLCWVRTMGPDRVHSLLGEVGVSAWREVGKLTRRERMQLAAVLAERSL